MNTPQMPANEDRRTRWLVIAAAVWLLLVSLLAIVNSVGLSRLAEQNQASAQDAQVQALGARLGNLEQQMEAAKRQPKPLAQSDLDATRQSLEERLARIEQAQATDTHDDVQALQARMGAIEARLKKAPPSAAAPRKLVEAAKPAVPEAPFNVVGVELRGGTRFLSVASPKASSMLDVWLLRPGDAIGAWRLQAIEARAAVFQADGQTVRIALP